MEHDVLGFVNTLLVAPLVFMRGKGDSMVLQIRDAK